MEISLLLRSITTKKQKCIKFSQYQRIIGFYKFSITYNHRQDYNDYGKKYIARQQMATMGRYQEYIE